MHVRPGKKYQQKIKPTCVALARSTKRKRGRIKSPLKYHMAPGTIYGLMEKGYSECPFDSNYLSFDDTIQIIYKMMENIPNIVE